VSRGLLGRRQAPTRPQQPAARGARVLTASGRRIDLDAARGTKYAPHVETWQQEAWAYRASIGEIRYAVGYLRKAVSRVRIFPAVAEPDGAEPTPLAEADGVPPAVLAAAEEALALLTAGTHDWAALLAPYAENFEVAGEAWLVGRPDPDAAGGEVQPQELWQVRSTQEIEATDRGWRLKDHPGDREGSLLSPESAHVSRLWLPHPQWRGLADSPMGALLGPCEELQLVSRTIRGASRSRLAGAGLLLVPDEIAFQAAPMGDDPDPEDVEADDFFTQLTRTMTAALEDEGDPSSVVPIVVKASAEALKEIRHLTLSSVVDEKLLGRIEAALRRIGAGLDVPPEIVTGMAEANHWTAWQIDASTIKMHVEPLLIEMLGALTSGYLRHALTAYGVGEEWARRVICWYDVTPLTVRQNRTDDARIGHERNVLSDVALVQALGFDPETDMPDEDELARRLAIGRGTVDATLMDTLLRMFLVRNLPEAPEPPAPIAIPSQPVPTSDPGQPDGETPGPDTGLPIAAAGAPQGPVLRAYRRESERLARVDRETRERLAAAADAAVQRAVERATARAASAANRNPDARAIAASAAPGRAYAALHDAGLTAALGLDPETLLAGAWDQLLGVWDRLTEAARVDAVESAARIAGQPAPLGVLGALSQLSARGWEWFTQALTREALHALEDPEADTGVVDEPGEDPGRPGRVTSLTRGALAIAGGLPAGHPGISPDGVTATGGQPPGGIASGDVITGYLQSAGRDVIGYEWVYGISKNHFEPHRRLDGVLFADFASPSLQNPESWPSATLAPGDHRGCRCDASPVWADGRLASLEQDAAADATYDDSYLQVLRQIAADDRAAGRTDTSAVRTVDEADRIATARPSRRS
jgi:hypothetical protein